MRTCVLFSLLRQRNIEPQIQTDGLLLAQRMFHRMVTSQTEWNLVYAPRLFIRQQRWLFSEKLLWFERNPFVGGIMMVSSFSNESFNKNQKLCLSIEIETNDRLEENKYDS